MAHILLLEPDQKLAAIYSKALLQVDHTVDVSKTAQGAVLAADTRQPDIVILELQLVGHSGIEFLYEFRSYIDWKNIPVIILSHISSVEFSKSSRLLNERLGVRLYLYKPHVTLRMLRTAITNTLMPAL